MGVERFKSGTIFGDTKRPHDQIKLLYPNAKFNAICGFGFYIQVYADNTETKLVANYMLLKKKETPTKEAIAEKKHSVNYFKLIWKD